MPIENGTMIIVVFEYTMGESIYRVVDQVIYEEEMTVILIILVFTNSMV
jgi:hypothetical protein